MLVARAVLGCLVGVAVAFVIVMLAEDVGYRWYPVPDNIDWSDAQDVRRYIDSLPVGAMLTLLAGWIGATFAGAAIGAAIARPRAILISTIVGGLMLAALVANFLMTPHPWWVVAAAVSGIVAATWLAAKLLWKPLPAASA